MVSNSADPVVLQQLLLTVAEELKLPLTQIARQVEHGRLHDELDLARLQGTADSALRLLDNYALGVRLHLEPQPLAIEPVSVSSVLYDASQQLDGTAKRYGVDLRLQIAGRFTPVMAHRQGLQSALVSLGTALIAALAAVDADGERPLQLQLATHRSRYGIVAGLYAETDKLTIALLKNGRRLQGRSRQPLVKFTHTAGAGIFVADTILAAMDLHLLASRHHRLHGLGTVLQPTQQLHLV